MKPVAAVTIFVLISALAVLGYLYYAESQDNVEIKLELPKVEVE